MTHERVQRHLSDYIEGDLAAKDRGRVERHLAECGRCSSELESLRRTVELLRSMPDPEPPPGLAGAVIARLRAGEAAPGVLDRMAGWFAGL